jgi:hypothetical protein
MIDVRGRFGILAPLTTMPFRGERRGGQQQMDRSFHAAS